MTACLYGSALSRHEKCITLLMQTDHILECTEAGLRNMNEKLFNVYLDLSTSLRI